MKCSFQWIKSIDLDFINVVPFVAMHILKEAETFPASFLNFKVIKVPAGSDFKVGSPNFKFWRTKKIPCSGGVCSTTLCMFSWFFFPLLLDCCLLEWMEAQELKKWQGQWWDFMDASRRWCSAGGKSSVEVRRPRAESGGRRRDRGTRSEERQREGKERGSWTILGVEHSENLDNSWPVPRTRTQSIITSCEKHAGGRKELMGRLHRSALHCKNVGGKKPTSSSSSSSESDWMRPVMFMKWGIKTEKKKLGEKKKLQKCSTVVVRVQSGERARTGIQRKLRCLWTMASRYLVGVERRWKSDDGSVCEQLVFPSRACMCSVSTDLWRE